MMVAAKRHPVVRGGVVGDGHGGDGRRHYESRKAAALKKTSAVSTKIFASKRWQRR
jgi:hypothetical protein